MYHKIDLQENERNKMTNEERGKHMKRKKLVAILLTAAMTAGMLAGCGSSGGSTGGTSDSKASSESTASSGTADNSSEEEGEDLAIQKIPGSCRGTRRTGCQRNRYSAGRTERG